MENFDMRILRLILEELVKTGRLHDGDKITPGTEVNKSALSLIYSHGVTIDGMEGEAGITIKGCTDGLVITLTSNEQETTTLLVDHQPFDKKERETLSPEVTIGVSPSGMLNIEVHENVYYAVSLAELQEYAADRVHTA